MKQTEEIIKILTNRKETISCMESCTGGGLASEITNIPGSSNVLHLSFVTYQNEAKISLGVNPKTIETYTVYSPEVAKEMAKMTSIKANSDWGIGVTGMLGGIDTVNHVQEGSKAFLGVDYAIYQKNEDTYFVKHLTIPAGDERKDGKQRIIEDIVGEFEKILESR